MPIEARGDHNLTLRLLPGPEDLNYNGHVSGAWILGKMDIAGGITAYRRAGGPIVTVSVNDLVFLHPLLLGDLVSLHTEIARIGTTSITVDIELWIERLGKPEPRLMTQGRYVYVAIDGEGRPRPVDLEE